MRPIHSWALRISLGLLLFMAFGSVNSDRAKRSLPKSDYKGFTTHVFKDAQGASITYYLHVPDNYDPNVQYPLVLLLHGGGESAKSSNTPIQNRNVLLNQTYVNTWASAATQARWPSFIVVPQTYEMDRFVNVAAKHGSYTLADQPATDLRLAKEIVDALQQQYTNIDATRLYVTGISMGGYGTWEAIERWPTYFAAAMPLSGAGDPSLAATIAQIPIWAFHGTKDPISPVSGSRDMIAALKEAGGSPHYTEYPASGHDIFVRVYTNVSFLGWLFAQHVSTAPVG